MLWYRNFREDYKTRLLDSILRDLIYRFIIEQEEEEPSKVYYLRSTNSWSMDSGYTFDFIDRVVILNDRVLDKGYEKLSSSSSYEEFYEWLIVLRDGSNYTRVCFNQLFEFHMINTNKKIVSNFVY